MQAAANQGVTRRAHVLDGCSGQRLHLSSWARKSARKSCAHSWQLAAHISSRRVVTAALQGSEQAPQQQAELRVCTGKTCSKQGSKPVLKFLQDLQLGSDVSVVECGCLGGCGNGPNILLLPEEQRLSHVATPADAAQVVSTFCGVQVDAAVMKATQLRLAGNEAAMEGNLQGAIQAYTEGLDLLPPAKRGRHLLLCNRAAALLQLGRREEALADARAAQEAAPPSFVNGWVRLIDCLYACGQLDEARAVFETALVQCPSLKATKEYKAIAQALAPQPAKQKSFLRHVKLGAR